MHWYVRFHTFWYGFSAEKVKISIPASQAPLGRTGPCDCSRGSSASLIVGQWWSVRYLELCNARKVFSVCHGERAFLRMNVQRIEHLQFINISPLFYICASVRTFLSTTWVSTSMRNFSHPSISLVEPNAAGSGSKSLQKNKSRKCHNTSISMNEKYCFCLTISTLASSVLIMRRVSDLRRSSKMCSCCWEAYISCWISCNAQKNQDGSLKCTKEWRCQVNTGAI